MSIPETVVLGSVTPDGALQLDERLQLPAGRVQITLRPVVSPAPPREDWWQFLQRARAELEAGGSGFRTREEIEAERESFRSGEERIEEVCKALEHERQ